MLRIPTPPRVDICNSTRLTTTFETKRFPLFKISKSNPRNSILQKASTKLEIHVRRRTTRLCWTRSLSILKRCPRTATSKGLPKQIDLRAKQLASTRSPPRGRRSLHPPGTGMQAKSKSICRPSSQRLTPKKNSNQTKVYL